MAVRVGRGESRGGRVRLLRADRLRVWGRGDGACPGARPRPGCGRCREHISEAELAPGDLVFLGSAEQCALPRRHVRGRGHDGGGSPHRRGRCRTSALVDNPWDGFGRLLTGPPASDPVASAREAAARRYGVPPNVVVGGAAALGLDRDPYRVAAAAARDDASARHSDLMSALTDQLGRRRLRRRPW